MMGSTHRRRRRKPAFTMVELVTVIVILGIVGGFVGGPTMAYIDSMRSGAAAARLTADVRYVQRVAVGSGLRTWVTFDDANDSYSLFREDLANPGKANRLALVHPLDQSTSATQFGTGTFVGVSIDSVSINGTSEVEFDSFGVPYDTNGSALTVAGTIVLSNGLAVQVHPVGGYVEQVTWP